MFLVIFELVVPILTLIGFGITGSLEVCVAIIGICALLVSNFSELHGTSLESIELNVIVWFLGLPLSWIIFRTIRIVLGYVNDVSTIRYIIMIIASIVSIALIVIYAISLWSDVLYFYDSNNDDDKKKKITPRKIAKIIFFDLFIIAILIGFIIFGGDILAAIYELVCDIIDMIVKAGFIIVCCIIAMLIL